MSRFLILYVFFWFSLDYFVLALFAFAVLGFVSSVLRHETGWEERLRNDLFWVEWGHKTSTQSIRYSMSAVGPP